MSRRFSGYLNYLWKLLAVYFRGSHALNHKDLRDPLYPEALRQLASCSSCPALQPCPMHIPSMHIPSISLSLSYKPLSYVYKLASYSSSPALQLWSTHIPAISLSLSYKPLSYKYILASCSSTPAFQPCPMHILSISPYLS